MNWVFTTNDKRAAYKGVKRGKVLLKNKTLETNEKHSRHSNPQLERLQTTVLFPEMGSVLHTMHPNPYMPHRAEHSYSSI